MNQMLKIGIVAVVVAFALLYWKVDAQEQQIESLEKQLAEHQDASTSAPYFVDDLYFEVNNSAGTIQLMSKAKVTDALEKAAYLAHELGWEEEETKYRIFYEEGRISTEFVGAVSLDRQGEPIEAWCEKSLISYNPDTYVTSGFIMKRSEFEIWKKVLTDMTGKDFEQVKNTEFYITAG